MQYENTLSLKCCLGWQLTRFLRLLLGSLGGGINVLPLFYISGTFFVVVV